jgi:hypothetical protein
MTSENIRVGMCVVRYNAKQLHQTPAAASKTCQRGRHMCFASVASYSRLLLQGVAQLGRAGGIVNARCPGTAGCCCCCRCTKYNATACSNGTTPTVAYLGWAGRVVNACCPGPAGCPEVRCDEYAAAGIVCHSPGSRAASVAYLRGGSRAASVAYLGGGSRAASVAYLGRAGRVVDARCPGAAGCCCCTSKLLP